MSWIQEQQSRMAFNELRISFLQDLAEVLLSGYGGLQTKLIALAERNKGRPIERAYRDVHDQINRGQSISTALKPYYSAKEHSLIAAYDAGAVSDKERGAGLLDVAAVIKPLAELRQAGVKLIARTSVSVCLIIFMWVGVAGGFAKDMEQLAPRSKWNPVSVGVIGSGEWLASHPSFTTIVFGGVIAGLMWLIPNWRGHRRMWFDHHAPLFKVYREYRSALTLISLAAFIKSKNGLSWAFKRVGESSNSWELWYLEAMLSRSTKTTGATMLDVGYFDERTIDRLTLRDEVMPLELALEQVGLQQAGAVVAAMKVRLESAASAADVLTKALGGLVVISVLLINLSVMSSLSSMR
jgi:type II secretory pathway component PulF